MCGHFGWGCCFLVCRVADNVSDHHEKVGEAVVTKQDVAYFVERVGGDLVRGIGIREHTHVDRWEKCGCIVRTLLKWSGYERYQHGYVEVIVLARSCPDSEMLKERLEENVDDVRPAGVCIEFSVITYLGPDEVFAFKNLSGLGSV